MENFRVSSRTTGPAVFCPICMEADLGVAFDAAGQKDSALKYLELYATEPNALRTILGPTELHFGGAHKRLGELYEERGDRARALAYYQKFVELWKDAEPELQAPVLDVRRRIERLRAEEAKKM